MTGSLEPDKINNVMPDNARIEPRWRLDALAQKATARIHANRPDLCDKTAAEAILIVIEEMGLNPHILYRWRERSNQKPKKIRTREISSASSRNEVPEIMSWDRPYACDE